MIPVLFAAVVILTLILVLLNVRHSWSMHKARSRGKLPQKGKATMFDVRHLLMEGDKDLAIELYCEIFNTTVSKAKKDIEQLQRSMKV